MLGNQSTFITLNILGSIKEHYLQAYPGETILEGVYCATENLCELCDFKNILYQIYQSY